MGEAIGYFINYGDIDDIGSVNDKRIRLVVSTNSSCYTGVPS